ncbi:hypothetical protein [Streptomyces sp. NPDC051567]|uniref:hypothetical protein n=1 Tax=Streptomyces sp. NPDC051567 TaxID=3365660 RepID=UPI00379AB689
MSEITDRRGSAVWRATGPAAVVAVKAGYGEGAAATAREAAVLDRLDGYEVTRGRYEDGYWLVTPWFKGPSTWEVFAPLRSSADSPAPAPVPAHIRTRAHAQNLAVTGAAGLARAVADLHAAGWVHADLQPAHGIHTGSGVRLLDVSWAWTKGFEPGPEFRGGITHLLAPELAASISVGIQPVTPDPAAEVYALAATLWTCVTGRWPLDYTAAGVDPKNLSPAQLRSRIANREVPLDRAAPWPALQDRLRDVLLAKPAGRPTAAELAKTLAAL